MYSIETARCSDACNARTSLNATRLVEQVMSKIDDRDVEHFWRKVNKTESCWLWTGGCTNGYGLFYYQVCGQQKRAYAHRMSWIISNGPILKGLWVLHRCDVRNCVNPSHLFLGTVQDNNRDMVQKGRNSFFPGETNPNAILTDKSVIEIRRRISEGEKCAALASEYKVGPSAIRNVAFGIRWKHLPLTTGANE